MSTDTFKNVLITFVGLQDPYTYKKGGTEPSEGPILTLLGAKRDAGEGFDEVVLFYTADNDKRAADLENAIQSLFCKSIAVKPYSLPIDDPQNHVEILRNLKPYMKALSQNKGSREYCVFVTPGTPSMHASWILLAASGEIPAKIIQKRDEVHLRQGQSLFSEVKPSVGEFPYILPKTTLVEIPDVSDTEIENVKEAYNIVGDHETLKQVFTIAARVAKTDRPVLLLGETGTGKDLMARFIHDISTRNDKPFIHINCGGLPPTLIESELFGHERYAFTGALQKREGKFVTANGGTLFLNEIGELPFETQSKLLKALDNGEIDPIGAKNSIRVDVRVIAATNQDLQKAREEKRFREDLFYRLNMFTIKLPPLRDRQSDIPKLANHFLYKFNREFQKTKTIQDDAMNKLQSFTWKGNIRDLRNVIGRAVQLSTINEISAQDVEVFASEGNQNSFLLPGRYEGFSIRKYLDDIEALLYKKALEIAQGNQTKAAKLLGVSATMVGRHKQRLE